MTAQTSKQLIRSLISTYRERGVVKIPQLFTSTQVQDLKQCIKDATENPGPFAFNSTYLADIESGYRIRSVWDFAVTSPAGEAAGVLMESNFVHFFYDQLFIRFPDTPFGENYHQDHSYWKVDGEQLCTIWVSDVAIPKEDGVRFVVGSHKWPINDGFNNLPPLPVISSKTHEIESFDLEPGDCICFHGKMVHTGTGNSTDYDHARFAFRYAGEDVRYNNRKRHASIPSHEPALENGEPLEHIFPLAWRESVCQLD